MNGAGVWFGIRDVNEISQSLVLEKNSNVTITAAIDFAALTYIARDAGKES